MAVQRFWGDDEDDAGAEPAEASSAAGGIASSIEDAGGGGEDARGGSEWAGGGGTSAGGASAYAEPDGGVPEPGGGARVDAESGGGLGGEVAEDVEGVAIGVVDAATGAASRAWDTVTGTVESVTSTATEGAGKAWDEVTDTASGIAEGVQDAAASAWDKLASTAQDVASGASDAASRAWDAVADGASRVVDTVESAASSAWNTVKETATGAWDAAVDTATAVATTVRDTAVDAWNGIRSAAGAAWDAVRGTIRSLWDDITNGVARGLETLAKKIAMPGKTLRSRGLTGPEITFARGTYQDAIDYGKVVITRGSLASAGSSRTTGNVIDMDDSAFDGDTMNLSADGWFTLAHELEHVAQFQRGGLSYIPDSLWEQLKAWRRTGTRNAAYDWRTPDSKGIPWEEWHAEQQAQAVEDYYKAWNFLRGKAPDLRPNDRAFWQAVYDTLSKYAPKFAQGPKALPGTRPATAAASSPPPAA